MSNFAKKVNQIKHTLSISTFKAEIIIEGIHDWSELNSLADIKEWFIDKKKNLSLDLEDIPLLECRGWNLDTNTGFISHKTGEFFYIQGVRIKSSGSREVGDSGWDQPMMTQVGFNGGILGLVRKKINEIPYYLVEAKAEPGNPDGIQLSPTLQATFSNLKAAHKGRKPHYSGIFEKYKDVNHSQKFENEKLLFRQWMSEDGGRLHLKRNLGMLVEVQHDYHIDMKPNYIWMTLYQIKELIKENSWINPHIRGIISSL